MRRLAILLPASLLLALPMAGVVYADTPPTPDFYWPYGQARMGGASLSPTIQPIVAFVLGKPCGNTQTSVAAAGNNVPASDIGKTVYVVDIAANGTSPGDIPGCGQPGDPVLFYLPALHRTALQQPQFHQGNERVDLDFDNVLSYQLYSGELASDQN